MLKSILLTSSILLAFGVVAPTSASVPPEVTVSAEYESATDGAISAPAADEESIGTVRASALVGSDLIYEDGSAPITDLLIDAEGNVDALIVTRGGFLGLFGEDAAVVTVAALIETDEDGVPILTARFTDSDLEAATDEDVTETPPFALTLDDEQVEGGLYFSDITGKPILNAEGETVAYFEDFEVDPIGEAQHAIIRDGGILGFGGELGRISLDLIEFEQTVDGEWTVTSTTSIDDIEVIGDAGLIGELDLDSGR